MWRHSLLYACCDALQPCSGACRIVAGVRAGVSGLMMLPAHFWQHTNFCPSAEQTGRSFPTEAVDWPDIEVRAVPGVQTAAAVDATSA